jgi:hypothetical protein
VKEKGLPIHAQAKVAVFGLETYDHMESVDCSVAVGADGWFWSNVDFVSVPRSAYKIRFYGQREIRITFVNNEERLYYIWSICINDVQEANQQLRRRFLAIATFNQ